MSKKKNKVFRTSVHRSAKKGIESKREEKA